VLYRPYDELEIDLPTIFSQFTVFQNDLRIYFICRYLVLNFTITWEHNFKSSRSIFPCHHYVLTPSAAYPKYIVQQVLCAPGKVYTENGVYKEQLTPRILYSEYSVHQVQRTPSTAYTKYSIHQVWRTPSTVSTDFSVHWFQGTMSSAWIQDFQSPPSTQSLISHFSVHSIVKLTFLHTHNYKLTNEYRLTCCCAS